MLFFVCREFLHKMLLLQHTSSTKLMCRSSFFLPYQTLSGDLIGVSTTWRLKSCFSCWPWVRANEQFNFVCFSSKHIYIDYVHCYSWQTVIDHQFITSNASWYNFIWQCLLNAIWSASASTNRNMCWHASWFIIWGISEEPINNAWFCTMLVSNKVTTNNKLNDIHSDWWPQSLACLAYNE